jgi:hypothetical protein
MASNSNSSFKALYGQAQTDNWIAQPSTGRAHKRRKDRVVFDKRLKNIVLDYKEFEIFDYFKKISFILE